ncbi:Crp/Fnr family transcriptional regulator [Aquincola sp. S2]|uniref:Crp/Fnr family transcriptional regulator n=1 Tax=Pseudaquabacterium terrae TaxID=2732868 RepID=A0ABX2ER76_9BURK|nr:Crp/Fnr family transcriptional regulator [Aquabacterium terrae]NRF70959.1 Crp/Fnr family transcriptional regulator [Aquabacterium terrae]
MTSLSQATADPADPAHATLAPSPKGWLDALSAAAPDAPADGLQALLPVALPVSLFRGAQLLSREQPAQRHWLLLSGQVAMGLAERGRMQQQTRDVRPGQWIDNASAWLMDGSGYLEDALVEQDGLALSFAHADLLRCGLRHPMLLAASAGSLVQRVQAMLGAELSLIRQSAESRFAAWLLQHAEAPVTGGVARVPQVVLRQRKRAIASQLGATPETFSRVLRQLITRGAVRARGYTIELLDLTLLHELATAGVPPRRV